MLSLLFANSVAFADDGVVAVVNNEVITKKDLNDFINFTKIQLSGRYPKEEIEQRINQMLPDLIDRLIEDLLILQAAHKEDIAIEQSRIKARIEQIKKNYPNGEDFENTLASQGLSLADLETKIKEQFLMFEIIDRKIKSKVVVKPQEVTEYYKAHKQDFNKPQQRRVRFVLLKDPGVIAQLEKGIKEYNDLQALAWAYSLEITDLGWVTSRQLKPEIADKVFGLKEGQLSGVLSSGDNSYVFEVEAIKPSEDIGLQELQGEINKIIFEKKMQEVMKEWLDGLKSRAYIEVKKEYGAS